MVIQRFSKWLLTERGKNFTIGVAATAGIGAFLIPYIPNTFLIEQYKDVLHCYRRGIPVPVKPELVERFNKAVQLAGIPEDEIKFYKPFSIFGFDVYHLGSAYSRFGSYIGIPVNFTYTDPDVIDKRSIKVMGESVHWELPEAKSFIEALMLSEKAQLYGLAREIRMTQTPKLLLDSLFGTFGVCTAYGIGHFLSKRLNFRTKPLGLRITLYGLVSAFTLVNYFFMKDFTQLYYERKVDAELIALHPTFVEGGLEFYNQILKRNVALRQLMGSDGPSRFSVMGNDIYWIRQRHVPFVHRKEFFESKDTNSKIM